MVELSTVDLPVALPPRKSLAQLVQGELERQIFSGVLAAGERLNEVALAQSLRVSRGPIREALRSLEEAGLVSFEKNRGAAVRVVSPEAAIEIYEIRGVMEALACRRAAARAHRSSLQPLRDLVEWMDAAAASGDVARFHRLNISFHEHLVELSESLELAVAYRRLVGNLTLFRLRTLVVEGSLGESNAEHRRIVEALAVGDGVAAQRIIQNHIESSSLRTQHALASNDAAPITYGGEDDE